MAIHKTGAKPFKPSSTAEQGSDDLLLASSFAQAVEEDSWRDTTSSTAQAQPSKLKTRASIGSTLLMGRYPRCLWEERVPLWMLFKHANTCRYRCSTTLFGEAEKRQYEEQAKKARRQDHTKRKWR